MSDDIMQSLRLRFCARLSEDIGALEAAADAGDRAAIRAVCHRMAGAGGMFGFVDLSAAASDAEEAVDEGETGDALNRRVARVLDLAREATASVCGAG